MIIISIELIGETDDYVYDLETKSGTFVAGSFENGILVKNTDSCYVQFPEHISNYNNKTEYMKANFKIAQECADYCTKSFKKPMKLEFEKYMYPFMLFAKKRYAYVEWTNPNGPDDDEIQYKGIQVVRRDTCRYVKEELNNIFKIIMTSDNKESANLKSIEYVKTSVSNLLNNAVDPSKLVLSKQLKSKYVVMKNKISKTCNWKNEEIKQPHVRLAQMMLKRDPANSPTPPSRIQYLFIEKKGKNGAEVLQCEKVIHPEDLLTGIYKIDSLYYFEHQYKKPIDMIFKIMDCNPELIYSRIVHSKINELAGQKEITSFFKKNNNNNIIERNKFVWNKEYSEEADSGGEGYDDE